MWILILSLGSLVLHFVIFILGDKIGIVEEICKLDDQIFITNITEDLQLFPTHHICITPACIQLANSLLQAMDFTIDPCEDFFQFACGNWNKTQVTPRKRNTFSQHSFLQYELFTVLKDILERESTSYFIPKTTRKVKQAYLSCRNEEQLVRTGASSIRTLLEIILGGLPLIKTSWNQSAFDVVSTLATLHKIGAEYFFRSKVVRDSKRAGFNILHIEEFEIDEFHDACLMKKDRCHHYLINLVKLIGFNQRNMTKFSHGLNSVISFMRNVHNLSIGGSPKEFRLRLDKLKSIIKIDLQAYFKNILPSGVSISPNENILIKNPSYFGRLGILLAKTDPKILANYFGFRMIFTYTEDLSFAFRDTKTILSPEDEFNIPEIRWVTCINYIITEMSTGLSALYVHESFSELANQKAQEMAKDVQGAFVEMISQMSWVSPAAINTAKEKIRSLKIKIGYSEGLLNETALEKFYKDVHLGIFHLFNKINLQKLRMNNRFQDFNKFNVTTRFFSPLDVSSPSYDLARTSIYFPAAVLQRPVYDPEQSRSINYGSTGPLLGYAMARQLLNQGFNFDKVDNYLYWGSYSASELLRDMIKCVLDKYYTHATSIFLLYGSGNPVEKYAETLGLEMAFQAYRKSVIQEGHEEPYLPGLFEFSHQQLFFIGFAKYFCPTVQRTTSLTEDVGRLRVVGPISNSLEFAHAFKCHSRASMNPPIKCPLW